MDETNQLIDQLTARVQPVRRLASPLRRCLLWLALAAALVAMITLMHGVRPGWASELSAGPAFMEWTSGLLTGVLAAYAVFQISVPGRSRAWAYLPVPALVAWLSGMSWGCMRDYARLGGDAFLVELASSECALAIAMTSVPLGLLMLLMVRHAGVVRPGPTAMLAGLSAAALSATGVSLYHGGESALMVLVWHGGAVIALSLASLMFGRPLFAWIGHAKR
ncbi:hypothetical protein N800_06985 [Lysobacter daejeonensis GH1-9]|uniref:DUF1109 domain-containing protein n=1 Tax=Lysobacter daejeonensis GH1-9 TaxID=1385517 RepID=A0A0A0ERN2_9GAMM|nr:NrsF family protein [Lysobacter daejeonensis]KGM53646.1 hypothetical protein N800_06985 [Lysobacter daejeonensis GH1-9]